MCTNSMKNLAFKYIAGTATLHNITEQLKGGDDFTFDNISVL